MEIKSSETIASVSYKHLKRQDHLLIPSEMYITREEYFNMD